MCVCVCVLLVWLQEEWRRLRIERAVLEDERRRFEDVRQSPWFQAQVLPTAEARRVKGEAERKAREAEEARLAKEREAKERADKEAADAATAEAEAEGAAAEGEGDAEEKKDGED